MRKTKFISLFAALSLIIGLTLPIFAATATGTKPDTIKDSLDLLYFIRFYGGSCTVNGNTVKLTSDMDNIPEYMHIMTEDDLTLDLNGHHMMFVNGTMYSIWNNSNGHITITDSSNSDNDFIRSTSATTGAKVTTTIYHGGKGSLTVENTRIICNSSDEDAISTYEAGSLYVRNSLIQADRGCAMVQAYSLVEFDNVEFKLGNLSCQYGVKVVGTNSSAILNNVTSTSLIANTPAVISDASSAYTSINGGTYTSKQNVVRLNNGLVIVRNGSFESKEGTCIHVINGELETYGGTIKGKEYGLTVSNTAKANLSGGTFIGTNRAGIGLSNSAGTTFNDVLEPEHFVTDSTLTYDPSTSYKNSAKEVSVYGCPVEVNPGYLTYNGKTQAGKVKVIDADGNILKEGTDYTINGAKAKKIGTYNVKVQYIGLYSRFTGDSSWFYIIPKGTSISKLTAGKKKVTVRIKKNTTETTNYQIMYSTSSNFSGGKTVTISNKTTSKTISKLKAKKKYYFKVRTLKKVGSKSYASTWSAVKSIKTK